MALWQGIFINKGLFYGLLEAFYKNSHLNEYVDGGGDYTKLAEIYIKSKFAKSCFYFAKSQA